MGYMLSNAEFVLLLLIGEQPGINGYTIRRLVKERGLSAWAGVGSSSIYNGLKKIEEQGLAVSAPDTQKQDRGPRGQLFRLTRSGRKALLHAIIDGLSSTREHDPRFNIALCGIDQLGLGEAAECLHRRSAFLETEYDRVSDVRRGDGGLPLSAELLFDRILHAIEAEQSWTQAAAVKVETVAGRPKKTPT